MAKTKDTPKAQASVEKWTAQKLAEFAGISKRVPVKKHKDLNKLLKWYHRLHKKGYNEHRGIRERTPRGEDDRFTASERDEADYKVQSSDFDQDISEIDEAATAKQEADRRARVKRAKVVRLAYDKAIVANKVKAAREAAGEDVDVDDDDENGNDAGNEDKNGNPSGRGTGLVFEPHVDNDVASDVCSCWGIDLECECQSDWSYDRSDADFYYELKERHEDRKFDLQSWKKAEQRGLQEQMDDEIVMEAEVQAAEKAVRKAEKKGKKIPIGPQFLGGFKLYSKAHVEHCYSDSYYPTKRVDMDYFDENYQCTLDPKARALATEVSEVQIYLNVYSGGQFGKIPIPEFASSTPLVLTGTGFEGGKFEVSFTFLGNGFLKLRVPNSFIFKMTPESKLPTPPPPNVPDEYLFYGIWYDPSMRIKRTW